MKKYFFLGLLVLGLSVGALAVSAQETKREKEQALKLPLYMPTVATPPMADTSATKSKTSPGQASAGRAVGSTAAPVRDNPAAVSGPVIVNIGPAGNVLLRGQITSVNNSARTFKVRSWGGEWTVKALPATSFAGSSSFSDLRVDGIVGVSGRIVPDDSFTIEAEVLRAWGTRTDTDDDGIPDNQDSDDDNDGTPDTSDPNPQGNGNGNGNGTPSQTDPSAPYGSRLNPRLMTYTTFNLALTPGATQANADAVINNRGSNIPIRAFGFSNGVLTLTVITNNAAELSQFTSYLNSASGVVSVAVSSTQVVRYYLIVGNWVSELDLAAWLADCPRQRALNPNSFTGPCPATF